MEVYRKWYRVTSGPVIDAILETDRINDAAHEEYSKILKEIGAEPGYYHRDRRLVSIVFKDQPDTGLYKKKDSGWYPKKNCKAGKDLAARLEAIKTANQRETLKKVGLSSSPSIFSGGKAYSPTLIVIPETPPVAYISTPWYDEDPQKITEYKENREKNGYVDSNLESVSWVPSAEMVPVKKWEVDRAIDEWNEKVKAENAA